MFAAEFIFSSSFIYHLMNTQTDLVTLSTARLGADGKKHTLWILTDKTVHLLE